MSPASASTARGSVTLDAPSPPGFIPKAMRLPIWHTRLVPDLAGGDPLVLDLARNQLTDFEIADVWHGTANSTSTNPNSKSSSRCGQLEITGGFRCSIAFTITGAEIRPNSPLEGPLGPAESASRRCIRG